MGKSISTTSNTPTNTSHTTFKSGDIVLCPSIGNFTYELSRTITGLLSFSDDKRTYHCHDDGRFNLSDALPSIFHDGYDNGNAVITLYGNPDTTPAPIQRAPLPQTSPRNDIDDVVLMSPMELSNIACDINGAKQALQDVEHLLNLIHYGKIDDSTTVIMARLAQDAAATWAEILSTQLEQINEQLALTKFSKVGA